jgi:hypothetical protein
MAVTPGKRQHSESVADEPPAKRSFSKLDGYISNLRKVEHQPLGFPHACGMSSMVTCIDYLNRKQCAACKLQPPNHDVVAGALEHTHNNKRLATLMLERKPACNSPFIDSLLRRRRRTECPQQSYFSELPPEIMQQITSQLSAADFMALMFTSHSLFWLLAADECWWKILRTIMLAHLPAVANYVSLKHAVYQWSLVADLLDSGSMHTRNYNRCLGSFLQTLRLVGLTAQYANIVLANCLVAVDSDLLLSMPISARYSELLEAIDFMFGKLGGTPDAYIMDGLSENENSFMTLCMLLTPPSARPCEPPACRFNVDALIRLMRSFGRAQQLSKQAGISHPPWMQDLFPSPISIKTLMHDVQDRKQPVLIKRIGQTDLCSMYEAIYYIHWTHRITVKSGMAASFRALHTACSKLKPVSGFHNQYQFGTSVSDTEGAILTKLIALLECPQCRPWRRYRGMSKPDECPCGNMHKNCENYQYTVGLEGVPINERASKVPASRILDSGIWLMTPLSMQILQKLQKFAEDGETPPGTFVKRIFFMQENAKETPVSPKITCTIAPTWSPRRIRAIAPTCNSFRTELYDCPIQESICHDIANCQYVVCTTAPGMQATTTREFSNYCIEHNLGRDSDPSPI